MQVIHKHVICSLDEAYHSLTINLNMVFSSEITHIAIQDSNICLWEVHDSKFSDLLVYRTFAIVGAGFFFDNYAHVGTVIDDPYVWHVCEVLNIC